MTNNYDFFQVAYAPVKMFPGLLLDSEVSQHDDGVREVVKMIKKLGESLGLRRKVKNDHAKCIKEPSFESLALHASGLAKHTEF